MGRHAVHRPGREEHVRPHAAPGERRDREHARQVVLVGVEPGVVAVGVEKGDASIRAEPAERLPPDVLVQQRAGLGARLGVRVDVAGALDAGAQAQVARGVPLALKPERLAGLLAEPADERPGHGVGYVDPHLARLGPRLEVQSGVAARAVLDGQQRLAPPARTGHAKAQERELVLVEVGVDGPRRRRPHADARVDPALVLPDPVALTERVPVQAREVGRVAPAHDQHVGRRAQVHAHPADGSEAATRAPRDLPKRQPAADLGVRISAHDRRPVALELEQLVGPVARAERRRERRLGRDDARTSLDLPVGDPVLGAAAEQRFVERVFAA